MKQVLRPLIEAHGNVTAIAFALLCFLMPIAPNALPLLLIVGVVGLLVHHWPWRSQHSLRALRGTSMPFAVALYALHVIGLAWSTNFSYALFDLQIKAPLIVLPLVLLVVPRSPSSWKPLSSAFAAGNAVAVLICCVAACWRILQGNVDPGQEIFGERFSFLVHPSYFALYLTFALVLLFLDQGDVFRSSWRMFIGTVLCAGVVLCGSKIGWALLPVVMVVVLALRWRDRSLRDGLLQLLAASLIGGLALIVVSAGVRDRLHEAWHSVVDSDRHGDAATSSEERKLAWDGATDVISANAPWGTGTGDVKDELIATYQRKGYVHMVEKKLNAHSEYLQMAAALGWPGLLFTLALVLVPCIFALRRGHTVAALFFGLNAANWAVESMLEVQAGVLFFTFFAFLLAQGFATPDRPELRSHDPVLPAPY